MNRKFIPAALVAVSTLFLAACQESVTVQVSEEALRADISVGGSLGGGDHVEQIGDKVYNDRHINAPNATVISDRNAPTTPEAAADQAKAEAAAAADRAAAERAAAERARLEKAGPAVDFLFVQHSRGKDAVHTAVPVQ